MESACCLQKWKRYTAHVAMHDYVYSSSDECQPMKHKVLMDNRWRWYTQPEQIPNIPVCIHTYMNISWVDETSILRRHKFRISNYTTYVCVHVKFATTTRWIALFIATKYYVTTLMQLVKTHLTPPTVPRPLTSHPELQCNAVLRPGCPQSSISVWPAVNELTETQINKSHQEHMLSPEARACIYCPNSAIPRVPSMHLNHHTIIHSSQYWGYCSRYPSGYTIFTHCQPPLAHVPTTLQYFAYRYAFGAVHTPIAVTPKVFLRFEQWTSVNRVFISDYTPAVEKSWNLIQIIHHSR